MKRIILVLAVGALLASAGCNGPANDATAKKVKELESKVETLEKRSNDLALKGQIVSSQVFGSPLDNFFAAPEFWENTYDSGQADCSRRCIKNLTAERKACENISDATQRQQCFKDAADRASRCHQQCAASNPTPIP